MKSNVSDLLELVTHIYSDACQQCIADTFDLRDLKTIRKRTEKEGVSFLTITLPSYARDLERALQMGYIDSTCFRSFRKQESIPAFLQGMISLIFSQKDGKFYESQNDSSETPVILGAIRQICLAFKKIEIPCTPKRVARALEGFVSTEQSLNLFSLPEADAREYSLASAMLWGNMFRSFDLGKLQPRHGPGSTSDHTTGNQKYVWRRWHERLEPYFPIIDFAYNISAFDSEELKIVAFVNPEQEEPVRVVTVPKTLKGPRIIAIEPVCMQYAQQAIRHELYSLLESAELTKGHVNFRDQSVNQMLALTSSNTGRFATIDLSDASDRVPRDLALEMFRSNPDLRDAIDACRSTRAQLPGGLIVDPLSKFASMGSALCFPIESMYFYTICVAALMAAQNLPWTHANVYYVSRDVYVYGDDIVVPTTYAMAVLDYLQKYNCKVNTSKTFISGKFRESCGVDAYDGEVVTPTYINKQIPKNRHQVKELISWVATANLFYKRGYWRTAQFMWCTCERYLGSLPYVSDTSPGLGRVSYLGYRSVERWNRSLQRFEVKAWKPRAIYRSDRIDGHPALQKSLSLLSVSDSMSLNPKVTDVLHLERIALHGAVALTRRWVPAT